MTGSIARRLLGDRVLVAGVLVLVAATAFRAWTAGQTWFYVDDFPLVATASRDGLALPELVQPYIGHLMPAGRASAWLVTLGGRYNYPVAIAELTLLYGLAGAGMLRLLRTLFGSRPAVLAPLVYFLFSPWLISPTTWWAAGINHLPALVATAWALDAVVRHLRTPSRRSLVVSVAWILAGLAFAELTLLAYLPITVVSAGYFARGSLAQRARSLWSDHRGLVTTHLLIAMLYLATYVATSWDPGAERPRAPWRDYLVNLLGTVLPTGFVGGPGAWRQEWSAQFDVAPSAWLRLLGLAALAGVFALSALTRERSLRAWTLPAVQLAASVVLMSQTRAVFGGAFILDLRFTTPLALGLALALALAFLPVQGSLECSEPRAPHWLVDRRAPVVVATGAFVALAVWSAATFPLLHVPDERSPARFFATFERSLDEHRASGAPVQLVDRGVPGFVFGGPEGAYSTALHMYGDRVRFPAVVQDDYYVLDAEGRLVHPDLDVVRREVPHRGGAACDGYRIGAARASIPLDGPVLGYVWRLRIRYSATVPTPVTIAIGGAGADTTLLAGTHQLEMSGAAPAAYDAVEVTGLDPGSSVCVTGVEIGTIATDADAQTS